jgi:hypothetical protein
VRPLICCVGFLVLTGMTNAAAAADKQWQSGTWVEVGTKRQLLDFGPGTSPFGGANSAPTMRALADVRTFVIESADVRYELTDTVAITRRSVDVVPGTPVTFAVKKNTVYVKNADGSEHKLRLTKTTPKPKS